MADGQKTPDIRILAGLKGGGELSGDSGQLIQGQLNEIAKKCDLQIQIGIDKKTLDSLKESIQKELNTVKLNINGSSSKSVKNGGLSFKGIKHGFHASRPLRSTNDSNYKKDTQDALKYAAQLNRIDAVINSISARYSKMKKSPEFMNEFIRLKSELSGLKDKDFDGIRRINTELTTLKKRMDVAGIGAQTFGQKFSAALKKFWQYFNVSSIVMNLANSLRQMWTNVVELDSAMTDLQVASGKNRNEIEQMIVAYHDLAKEIGATTLEVAQAADTWLRQGYNTAEATELIRASMMLSKLGQIESSEASKALTSAMKGYKVEVEDVVSVVDKLTAVDMVAAVSAGDIATAMAETAVSADVAGVSMDKLIGYLATVQEITQDGSESVGNFAKTLFARMGNIKAGNLEDPESGENLSDVETVLNSYGINLRQSNNEFRNFGTVLDEVAKNWNNYSTVAQRAIAVAFSGTRQQEKFLVLMENYDQALELASISTESLGTATDKYSVYMDSMEAKLSSLKAASMDLSDSFINSDFAKKGVGVITDILEVVTKLIDAVGVLPTALAAVGTTLVAKNFGLTQNDGLYIWAIHIKEAA